MSSLTTVCGTSSFVRPGDPGSRSYRHGHGDEVELIDLDFDFVAALSSGLAVRIFEYSIQPHKNEAAKTLQSAGINSLALRSETLGI